MSQKFDTETLKRNSVRDLYPKRSSSDHVAMHQAVNNFTLKISLLDFAHKTSLNGPPFIVASTNWITRSIWIFLFVCGIGLTVYNVIENVLEYLEWPITTQLSLDYSTLVFPMVTICNVNPVRRSYIKDMPDDLKHFLTSLDTARLHRSENVTVPPGRKKRFIDDEQYDKNTNKSYIPHKFRKFEDTLGGTEDVHHKVHDTFKFLYGSLNETMRMESGHNLTHMMLQCSFESRKCDDIDFSLVQSNTYGNCYSYNTEGNAISKRRGHEYGLTLMLYLELGEYITGLSSGYGMRISLSDQNLLPFPEVDGLYLSAGMETDVGIRLVNITRLGSPYGVCESDARYLNKYGIEYSRQFCQGTCEHDFIQDKCSCFEQMNKRYYPKSDLDSLSPCSTDTQVDCMNDIKTKSLKNKLNCSCPSPCTEKTFDTEISSRQWPTPDYLDALIDKVCREGLKRDGVINCNRLINAKKAAKMRNFLKLNVFYRDLNFQVVEQKASYPWYTFLSDLGGAGGLYLGISVLGIFEIFHLVLLIISTTCGKLTMTGQLNK